MSNTYKEVNGDIVKEQTLGTKSSFIKELKARKKYLQDDKAHQQEIINNINTEITEINSLLSTYDK